MNAELTVEDKRVRSRGIGSSEIAMLLPGEQPGTALSPWGGPHKLWRIKTGREPRSGDTHVQARGKWMEPALANWWAADNGFVLTKPRTAVHVSHPIVVDSVDGLAFVVGASEHQRTLEVKTADWSKSGDWGDQGTDEVPFYYLVQCQWHEAVWPSIDGICSVVADIGGRRRDYEVPYDGELFGVLLETAEKFWRDHVLADKAPPVDGTPETGQWLSRYLQQKNDGIVEANDETVQLMLQYRALRLLRDEYDDQLQCLENQLKDAIGENKGIVIPGTKSKITWNRTKGSTKRDDKAIADTLLETLDQEARQALISQHTYTSEGARRFWPSALLKHAGENE